ncbi:sialic acid TRAP transporter permease protein SiaT [mine drainage metagenome]|uniref:Sialic acid TRAP transporter permease protein SiaT n=1 Tax=mine drainage metagenome TaxID=410659 RepID=A0A1J5PZS4_9ZZZZ
MTDETGLLDILTRILDGIAWTCMVIAGVLMVVLIAIFGWLVWGRYVMNDTPTWVEQAALVMVVWITFLGAAVGVRRRTHLSIDFVREAMPKHVRVTLTFAANLMMVGFGIIMAWQGWNLTASTMARIVPMLGISEGWRAIPIAICGVLMTIYSLEHLVALIRGTESGA